MLTVLPILLLTVWLALPLAASVAILLRRVRMNPLKFFILTTALGCCTFIAATWISEYQLQLDLNQYDLDGDGGFDEAELTPEARKALADWANDAGVGLGAVIGVFATIAAYAFVFAISWIPVTLAQSNKTKL